MLREEMALLRDALTGRVPATGAVPASKVPHRGSAPAPGAAPSKPATAWAKTELKWPSRDGTYWLNLLGIGLLLFGLIIEACQRMVTYRSAEWLDVWADAAGIILGLVIGAVGIGGWCLRVEERLAKRQH